MISIAILWLAPLALVDASTQDARDAHAHHEMPMTMEGALGAYPMSRDASGTAWQPDATAHAMGHVHARRLDADGPR